MARQSHKSSGGRVGDLEENSKPSGMLLENFKQGRCHGLIHIFTRISLSAVWKIDSQKTREEAGR